MKRFFLRISCCCLFYLVQVNNLGAQSCDFSKCTNTQTYYPLPEMFVPRDEGKNEISEFKKNRFLRGSKNKKLTRLYGNQDYEETFTWTAFSKMIDKLDDAAKNYTKLKIYLARFDGVNIPPSFPKEVQKGKLILLFSPDNGNKSDLHYYFMNSGDNTLYEIDTSYANYWKGKYVKNDLHALRRTIFKRDEDNRDSNLPDNARDSFSDTRMVFYSKNNIDVGFTDEINYQKTHNKIWITAIKVNLAAYTKAGRKLTLENTRLDRKRLHLEFDYVKTDPKGNIEIFDLEDDPDFCCRLNHSKSINPQFETNATATIKKKEDMLTVNNGTLCPANCQ